MGEIPTHPFMHPEGRAAAPAGAEPLDRISLRGYIADVEIGAFQVERGNRQRIEFNVVAEVAPQEDPDDDVDRILSYDRLKEAISAELESERVNLLETLAERVAARILAEPRAMRVLVRIEKLDRGPGALGVEIVRSRGWPLQRPLAAEGQRTVGPKVVFLTEEVATSARLASAIDRLELEVQSVVFCVASAEAAAAPSGNPQVRLRIGLLAVEQSAWKLSARDSRFLVADTRTEIDWALNNGRIPIWAPTKMVLAAARVPEAVWNDPLGLVVWFAGEINASELLTVGVAPPAGVDLAARELTLEHVE